MLTLVDLAESGESVERGDVIARLDSRALQDGIDDQRATLVQSQADIRKRIAEQRISEANLAQDIQLAKAELDQWKIEAGAAEIRTVVDREVIKLAVEEAEAAHREKMAELEQALAANLKVMDVSKIRVEASSSQAESGLIRIGQRVHIGLDAFSEVRLEGQIHSIGATAIGSGTRAQYVRKIPIHIRLDGSHPMLIPDLSASAEVVTGKAENATLRAPDLKEFSLSPL